MPIFPVLPILLLGISTSRVHCMNFGAPPDAPSTGARLYFGCTGQVVADYEVINASMVHYFDDESGCDSPGINDGLWCQGSSATNNAGAWYHPDGTLVPSVCTNCPLHANTTVPGQIALLKERPLQPGYEGLYTCIIPDENNKNITLRVALYNTSLLKTLTTTIDGDVVFAINSTRDRDPPLFMLRFNVSQLPPTNVTCTANEVDLDNISIQRNIFDTNLVIEVAVTISSRVSGIYRCSVSSAGVSAVANITLSVTNEPTQLSFTRINSTSVNLTWLQPVNQDNSIAIGYEIFISEGDNADINYSGGETDDTHFVLSNLVSNTNYSVFVVAYGEDLPSEHSNTVTIISDNSTSIQESPNWPLVHVLVSIGAAFIIIAISIAVAILIATLYVLKKKKRDKCSRVTRHDSENLPVTYVQKMTSSDDESVDAVADTTEVFLSSTKSIFPSAEGAYYSNITFTSCDKQATASPEHHYSNVTHTTVTANGEELHYSNIIPNATDIN